MKWNQTKYATLMLGAIAATSLLLSACGGGGGGGGSTPTTVTYTGNTSAANVGNEASAVKLSSTAVSTATSSPQSLPTPGVMVASNGASTVERMRHLADMVMNHDFSGASSSNLAGVTGGGTITDTGCGGVGTAVYTVTFNDINANGQIELPSEHILTASVIFTNYKEDFQNGYCDTLTYSGTASITFLYEDLAYPDDVSGLTFGFTNLVTTDDSGATEAMNGSYTLSVYPEISLTMTADYQDATGSIYRAKDYKVVLDIDGNITSISGILCDPVEGCIIIATNPVFSYDYLTCPSGEPLTGVMTIHGYEWSTGAQTSEYISLDANTGVCATYQVCWTGTSAGCVSPDPMW